jgi:replicative DNA helicase
LQTPEQTEVILQRLMLEDIQYIQKLQLRGVSALWFTTEQNCHFVGFIFDHFEKYHTVVNLDVIINKLKSVRAGEFILNTYVEHYNKIVTEITDIENAKENFEFYFTILRDEKAKIDFNNCIKKSIAEIQENRFKSAIEIAETGIRDIRNLERTESVGKTLRETADDRIAEYLDRKEHPEKYVGIPSGLREFDVATNGFRAPDLCLVVARAAVGKSIVLAVIARNMFLAGYNIAYGSIEISKEMSLLRLESSFTELSFDFLRDGKLSAKEEELFINAYNAIKAREADFYNVPADKCNTPDGIREQIDYFQNTYNKKLHAFFVDYVGVMNLDSRYGKITNTTDINTIIIKELKQICRDYDVNIWTAAQQTRESKKSQITNKNYEVGTEAIASADVIGNTVDFAVAMEETKDDVEDGTLSVSKIKVRFGGNGKFKLKKNWHKMSLMDLDADDTDDYGD